jgi:rhamnopyranosyl-N-acetylglucosaminyl-diphospho-decaprenol beta-1,3/1,4-galactofuranosyltransferase
MRILAHIHTFNDADVIDQTIAALLRQTRPVDGILVVDNASTDGTLDRPSLADVDVLRHDDNLGTSGAIHSGFEYALAHGYDSIWLFDADSVPEPDALEKLLDLYASWPKRLQDETAFLTCLHFNVADGVPRYGGMFTESGLAPNTPKPEESVFPCHFTVWSGCLYRLAAVREIGLPNANYVLDWGEGEYGYRVMKAGYKGFIHRDAVLHHNIRGYASVRPATIQRGARNVTVYEFPPIRCYYSCRNMLYFMLYEFGRGQRRVFLRSLLRPAKLTLSYLVRPWNHGKHLVACVRGIWHGVTGNIAARY